MPTTEEVTARFERSVTNHTPTPAQLERIEAVRDFAKEFGGYIVSETPGSREQSLALTHLEEVVMWAVKGIILN